MRTIALIILTVLGSNFAFSGETKLKPDAERGPIKFYTIVSDELDKHIAKGYFRITGTVKMYSSNLPVSGAEIGQYNPAETQLLEKENITTDSAGNFDLTLPVNGHQFCAYYSNLNETCIADYNFKSQHRIKVEIYLYQQQMDVKRKPVIYLYSDEPLSASIKLNPYGNFIFSYPEYKDSWDIELDDKNILRIKGEERTYPYLFWEAETHDLLLKAHGMDVPGFFIKSDTAVSFLEKTLVSLGLNETEKTDFITYWGPIIERDEYALLQFLIDDECQKMVGAMEIQPKPESIRRIYLNHSPYQNNSVVYNVQPQEITPFERKGFTVVEWGGGQIDLEDLKP